MPELTDLPTALRALVDRGATLVQPPTAAQAGARAISVDAVCRNALAKPVGASALSSLGGHCARIAIIVSDATRDEPRAAMYQAVRSALGDIGDERITLVIASGTHAPRAPSTVLPAHMLARHTVIVHDGLDEASTVDLGVTRAGTRVRVNRAVAEADLVIVTGRIRPHYFAGYSGGAKGIFPGCALASDARQNHLLKASASARLGRVDDNACRLDLEDAATKLGGEIFLLNVIADRDGAYVDAVAGHVITAHREACRRAAPLFVADAPTGARVIVTSDAPPVTDSLYQAAKLLPPCGPVLAEGGTLILVAACNEGTGPIDTVNKGIYELGVRHHLPSHQPVRLVSTLDDDRARQTFARPAKSIDAALEDAGLGPSDDLREVAVLWRASELIPRVART